MKPEKPGESIEGDALKPITQMKTTLPSDWKALPLGEEKATISLDRTFSKKEIRKIRRGLIPDEMEDKWFVYWEDDILFFHRSWTGICIYVVRFADEGGKYKMIEADVNRDREQYKETSDDVDARMISYLVDVLLLHQEAVFPSEESSDQKRALMTWSQVGRAMLGKHPNDE